MGEKIPPNESASKLDKLMVFPDLDVMLDPSSQNPQNDLIIIIFLSYCSFYLSFLVDSLRLRLIFRPLYSTDHDLSYIEIIS